MRKFIAMLLAVAMLLSLCACDSSAKTENGIKYYQPNKNTITSADGMVEVTIDSYCFTDYWGYLEDRAAFTPFDNPDDAWYTAEEGNTFLMLTGTVTLVGEIQEMTEYYLSDFTLDYNGNTFKGKWKISEPGVKNNSSSVYFAPQTDDNTRVATARIEIPEGIEADTKNPLQFTSRFVCNPESSGADSVTFTVQLR